MAINFNLLQQAGPTNLYEGFMQGQEAVAQNAMAQQEAAQKREFNDLRKQQIMSEMRTAEQTQNRALIAERTQQYKDRLLRARTPDAVRNLIRQRHADPILGPATKDFGSLDDDLAEVPDDVNALPDYLSREAMGAAEFIKSQQENRRISQIIGGGVAPAAPAAPPGVATTPIPESPPMNAMAPAPTTAAPPAQVNALRPPAAGPDVAELRRQRDALLLLGGPRAKALADKLQLDITAAQQKPSAPPAMVAEYTFAKTPEGGNFKGTFQEFVTARAAATRAPVQPVAPTITQIVDPKNPNQMITIDARRYTGGSVGSPGVLGVGGKEPGAAVRANKAEEGKTQLADDLDNLRASFTRLDEMRAIPSTARGALSNIASATAATGIGQTAGRFVGTEAQVEREVINSARTRLVNSIKNATGMSAQQLNSNVELQTMLKSISDPGQPIEAALRIIDDIENAYVKGAGMSKKKPPAAGGATGGKPTPAATSSGATVSNW